MRKEYLKARAQQIVDVPDTFEVFIEDFSEDGNGEGEAIFVWINEEEDSSITVKLDSAGNLTAMILDLNLATIVDEPMVLTEKKKRAEQFLLEHYPDALKDFTYHLNKKMDNRDRFYYKQLVMELPLDNSGCYIDVDATGKILTFTYEGVKPLPDIPAGIIPVEALRRDVQSKLDFELTVTHVANFLFDIEKEGLRLVYEPVSGNEKYKADEMQPTFKFQREDDEVPETYQPLPVFKLNAEHIPNEEIIGITPGMEIIREVDMGEELGIVWRDQGWDVPKKGKTMNDFFKQQTESTVKSFISKATGKVLRFAWFYERTGSLNLSRNECYPIAIRFLRDVIPEFYPYLQQVVRDDEGELSKKESFVFSIHNGHGISVESEIIMVAVNRSTGFVDYYSGPTIELEELKQLPKEAEISEEEAVASYLDHLDFELAWEYDYDQESQKLIYTPCEKSSRTQIRYIDAITGEVIVEKD